jgi:hypothetical protein
MGKIIILYTLISNFLDRAWEEEDYEFRDMKYFPVSIYSYILMNI